MLGRGAKRLGLPFTSQLFQTRGMRVGSQNWRTVWMEGSTVKMINQHLIPYKFEISNFPTCEATGEAIQTMVVRGAGAIGATAGFSVAQAALAAPGIL